MQALRTKGRMVTDSESTLPYRLTLDQIIPYFNDMESVIHEAFYALRDTYDRMDDPPGWWSRLHCLHDDILEESK